MKIEFGYKQFRVLQTTMILAAQGPPPYSVNEIKLAADTANEIKWRVEVMP